MTFNRVVAVDPGLVTGLVNVVFDEDGQLHGFEAYQLDHMDTGHYFAEIRPAHVISPIPLAVIIEKFTITGATAKNSQAPWSLETIGICRYFCGLAGVEPRFQMPSQAMGLCKDDVLKRAGMWTPGAQHSNDAARHALYFAMTELGIQKECLRP